MKPKTLGALKNHCEGKLNPRVPLVNLEKKSKKSQLLERLERPRALPKSGYDQQLPPKQKNIKTKEKAHAPDD